MFGPAYPEIDMTTFKTGGEWKGFYRNTKEVVLPNAITPRYNVVDLCMMVNSDHARDKAMKRSRTRFMILLIWL